MFSRHREHSYLAPPSTFPPCPLPVLLICLVKPEGLLLRNLNTQHKVGSLSFFFLDDFPIDIVLLVNLIVLE